MKTLYMTKGLPASGKTTWAKRKMKEHPGSYKRVNKDDLRAMVDDGHWSGSNEKFILGVRDYVVSTALNAGLHVIVDDTNLVPKHEARLRQLAQQGGAAFEVVDFTHVGVEECIARDQKRPNYVGEPVIRKMWRQHLAPKIMPALGDSLLPSCVIVDVDGTIALMNNRGPFEWERVGEDVPNKVVCRLLETMQNSHEDEFGNLLNVIFVSGRDGVCRAETEKWIDQHVHVCGPLVLFMRPEGDSRDDRIVKREIYEREIQGKYNVYVVIDDRDKVVRMWRELGLTCFQVAEGDF